MKNLWLRNKRLRKKETKDGVMEKKRRRNEVRKIEKRKHDKERKKVQM
jgi:hypothetical protein